MSTPPATRALPQGNSSCGFGCFVIPVLLLLPGAILAYVLWTDGHQASVVAEFDGFTLSKEEIQKEHCPACRLDQITFPKGDPNTAIVTPDQGQCLTVSVGNDFELEVLIGVYLDATFSAKTGTVEVCDPSFGRLYRLTARKR